MYKKAMAFIFCMYMVLQSVPLHAIAEETTEYASTTVESNDSIDEDILDISSYTAVSGKTVNDILEQSKFTSRQGHGFAAERGNNLADRIKGKNAHVVGDNNVKNGADRLILERDGTEIWIQDKYYSNAKAGIEACFDENGLFRYVDGNGNPMLIEVPKDQYEEAIECMKKKITDGKIPGVSDPQEAETLVKKGSLTYKQAVNLSKAGTIESLEYDATNGVVTAACSLGISALLNYSVCRLNGDTIEEATRQAAEEGLKTGGLVFCSSVIASQLSKTGMMKVFEPSSEALVKALGKDFSEALIKSTGEKVVSASGEAATQTITRNAAKVLRTEAITAAVTIVVFSVPDAIDLFNGRISKTQFVKNFAVTAVTIVCGTAGGIGGAALSQLVVPGVGTIPGSIIGSLLAGGVGGWAADKIADYITDDDAEKMYEIVQNSFAQKCEDYLVTESEAQNIVEQLSDMLDEDMYKDMYQSENREEFIDNKLNPLFEQEVEKRPKIEKPTEEEMRENLKAELTGVVFIH